MAGPALDLPDLDGVEAWVRAQGGPIVHRQLARGGPARAAPEPAPSQLTELPPIAAALERQRRDGSWGESDEPRGRILPTLWLVKVLAEMGLDQREERWQRACSFLAARAHTDDGVFSIDGSPGSVLCCYVGVAGESYLLGGRPDLARAQIDWIERHQEVRVRGVERRTSAAEPWDERLRTRYGGCLAPMTTCLLGLVKAGRALLAWHETTTDPGAFELVELIREVFLERRLLYRADGGVVPLGVSNADAERWLEPTFPLDWHTDLIEVLDLVARAGRPDARMQPAIDHLAGARLDDGSWPLRRSFRPPQLPALERRSRRRGSPVVTARAVAALSACRPDAA